jgi:hypothetical protein
LPELEEGFLDAAGGGGCDALVDGKCLFQAGSGFAGVAVAKMAAADAFQGACFLRGMPKSRAMASAWAWWSQAWPPSAVRDASSPRLLTTSAWPCRSPRWRNRSRACWWLAAAVGSRGQRHHPSHRRRRQPRRGAHHRHVGRHTFATTLIRGGTDLVAVADMLGQARLDTVRPYTHPSAADRERALNLLPYDADTKLGPGWARGSEPWPGRR